MSKPISHDTPGMYRSARDLLLFCLPCLVSAVVMLWLVAQLVGWVLG